MQLLFIPFFTDTTAFDQLLVDIDNMSSLMDRLITSIVFIIFYMISEILLKAKTIGKYITKTVVAIEDGSKPKSSDILLRSLCRLIPFEAFSFLGAKGKGWHDTISKTYVVDEIKFKIKAQSELEQIGTLQEID